MTFTARVTCPYCLEEEKVQATDLDDFTTKMRDWAARHNDLEDEDYY